MILQTLIASLRANAPIFGGRVAGAAEFYAGLKNYNTSMALPAAYVLPLGQDAEKDPIMNGLIQVVHKFVGVAVELDAQQDRRGQAPTMDFDEIEANIFRGILNLYIDPCRMSTGTYLTAARYLDLDRARLFYQWEFGIDWTISDLDGVQPNGSQDPGVDLQEIDVDIHLAPLELHPEPAAVVHLITNPPPHEG